jgi:hypothetical protein
MNHGEKQADGTQKKARSGIKNPQTRANLGHGQDGWTHANAPQETSLASN